MKTVKFTSDIDTTKELEFYRHEYNYEGKTLWLDFCFTPKSFSMNCKDTVTVFNAYCDKHSDFSIIELMKNSLIYSIEDDILLDLLG